MDSPKISIVIPVYNTEKYLKNCIESLLNQTLKEIEIICVNDGSTDGSCDILNSFALKDERIIVLNQKNKGQSAARNLGMRFAKGEYIGFIDSDDWAELDMFEKLYKKAKEDDADLTICNIKIFEEKTKEEKTYDPYLSLTIFPDELFQKAFSYQDTKDFIFRICVTPWNKIYKKSWIFDKNLFFIEGLNFEDNVFNLQTLVEAEKINLLKEHLVIYRKESETSYTFSNKDYKKLDFFKIFDIEEKFLKEKGIYEPLKEYFLYNKKNTLVYWYKKLTNTKTKTEFLLKLLKLYPDFLFTPVSDFIKSKIWAYKLKNLLKTKKIVFWGAGLFLEKFILQNKIKSQNIIGVIDSNPDRKGQKFLELEIFSPDDLKELKTDVIIYAVQNYHTQTKPLAQKINELGYDFDYRFFE